MIQQRNKKNETESLTHFSENNEPIEVKLSTRHIHSLIRLINNTNSILLTLGGILSLANFAFGTMIVICIYAILAGPFLFFVDFSGYDWIEKYLLFLITFTGRALVFSFFGLFFFCGQASLSGIFGIILMVCSIFFVIIGVAFPQVPFPKMPLALYTILADDVNESGTELLHSGANRSSGDTLSQSSFGTGNTERPQTGYEESIDISEMV